MKRIIIINYKYLDSNEEPINPTEIKVDKDNEALVVFVNYKKEGGENCFSEVINKYITQNQSSDIIVLCHTSEINGISKEDLKIERSDKLKLYNFSGTENREEFIYKNIISSNYTSFEDFENFIVKEFARNDFDNAWDWYWNKLDLENQKKKLINLWLPLAIDIQGLSEVQNDTQKAEKYFKEVKKETEYLNSLSSFPKEEDFPRWEEIKEELKNGYNKFDYKDLVDKFIKNDFNSFSVNTNYLKVEKEETEELKQLKSEVDNLKSNNRLDEFEKKKKELEEKMKNPHFLPNWLQEVVNIRDEKIKDTSKPVKENEVAKS